MKNVWVFAIAIIIAYIAYNWMNQPRSAPDTEKFDDNKNKEIHLGETTVILYYADWCPHCVRFKPVWQFVKARMESETVHFKAVDCTSVDHEVKTPDGTSVAGFPSMFMYRNGREHYYEGKRTTEDVLKWIRSVA